MEPAGACPAKKSARVFVARRWKSNDVWTAPTGCVSAVATSACATARQPRRARQVLPAYGLQDSPQIHSQEFTKVLLQAIHGGHFNMAENRTFLLCVDITESDDTLARQNFGGGLMRAVVTGAAGFLGSHLCDRLLAEGWSVLGLDNYITGRIENLAHLKSNAAFSFEETDVCDALRVAGEVTYVLHFASPASPPDYLRHPIETMRVGSVGTQNALELARAKGARFFIASTSECYGDPEVSPQHEEYWGHVNSVGPRSVYDESKRFSEALTMGYHRHYGLDTRIVRIFNTYGPRMRLNDGRALPNFVFQALSANPITVYGDGKQTRSFCYVSDLIDGIYRLMLSDEHFPVNVGNPLEITILEFAERVRSYFPKAEPIVFEPLPQDDPRRRCPDIRKAKRLLGWEPKVQLADGLRLTIDYFQKQYAAQSAR